MTIPRLSALILLVSVAAGGVVALAAPPPGSRTRSASVVVWPVQPDELQAAALPTLAVPEQGGRAQFAPGPSGSGRFAASAESDEAALASALAAARSYVRTLMAAQNRWIVGSQKSSRPSLQRRRARQSLLGAPQRYMLIYDEPRLGPTSGGAPFRGGLVGILVGGLAVATLEGRRPRRPRRTTGAVESRLRALLLAAVPLLLAAASSGLLVAATSAGPTDLYPLVVIGILFASASLYAFPSSISPDW